MRMGDKGGLRCWIVSVEKYISGLRYIADWFIGINTKKVLHDSIPRDRQAKVFVIENLLDFAEMFFQILICSVNEIPVKWYVRYQRCQCNLNIHIVCFQAKWLQNIQMLYECNWNSFLVQSRTRCHIFFFQIENCEVLALGIKLI